MTVSRGVKCPLREWERAPNRAAVAPNEWRQPREIRRCGFRGSLPAGESFAGERGKPDTRCKPSLNGIKLAGKLVPTEGVEPTRL
jgi:hypothetical protein